MGCDLVIFDCDGVLVDSEPITNQAIADSLAEHGLMMNLAQTMGAFVGLTMPGVAAKARALGADLPDTWLSEVEDRIHSALANHVQPIPGIVAVLDALDLAGLPYCVASNGSLAKMEITLGRTGLAPHMQGRIFAAHELGVAKPDPDLFLIAARHMGVAAGRCVVVEDSATGALAARRAGMGCLGYAPGHDGAALEAQGAAVFTDMAELPGLLGLM